MDTDILDILANKKVLYAEDEKGIRKHISEVLELFFDTVVSVEDGLEATYEMDVNRYDVLMFDICMPHLDGLSAIKKIREKDKKIPIIILSAHAEKEYLWNAVELKISKYLIKPYDTYDLKEALKMVALELVDNHLEISLKDGYVYNPVKKVVHHEQEEKQLTLKESRLLEYFITRANQSISFDEIGEYLWDSEIPPKEAIKSVIKELRRKVGKACITNIYGIGYMLEL